MADLNELDASILATIAQYSIRARRKLKPSEVNELLSQIQNPDAKLIASFFVAGKSQPSDRPDLEDIANKLRSWAERNIRVHGSTSTSTSTS